MKRTSLYEKHLALGAKMVPFAGWEMPVQYAGVIKEQEAVRKRAGLFDVSHMGEVAVTGPGAEAFLDHLLANDVASLTDGRALYTLMLNERGGAIDDLLVYRRAENDYLLVVNAGNEEKDFDWISRRAQAADGVTVANESDAYALLALQGPAAITVAEKLFPGAGELPSFSFASFPYGSGSALVSRTGYTGEDGVEIYVNPAAAAALWDDLLKAGRDEGVEPCGLAARDLLRIEAGLPLYGHELDEETDPISAGLKWTLKKNDADYIGRDALKGMERTRRRVAFTTPDRRTVPREGYPLFVNGEAAGSVVSGTFSPTLQKGVGIGYISSSSGVFPKPGEEIQIEIRGRKATATVCKLPFVRRSA